VKQLKDELCEVVISIFEVLVSQEKFDNWSTEGRSLKYIITVQYKNRSTVVSHEVITLPS